jgi:hypothetical protein
MQIDLGRSWQQCPQCLWVLWLAWVLYSTCGCCGRVSRGQDVAVHLAVWCWEVWMEVHRKWREVRSQCEPQHVGTYTCCCFMHCQADREQGQQLKDDRSLPGMPCSLHFQALLKHASKQARHVCMIDRLCCGMPACCASHGAGTWALASLIEPRPAALQYLQTYRVTRVVSLPIFPVCSHAVDTHGDG